MKKFNLVVVVLISFSLALLLTLHHAVNFTGAACQVEQRIEGPESEATHALEAMQWYNNQRAYPSGEIPYDWRGKAFKHIRQFNVAKTFSQSSILSWTSVGPNNLGGRVRSVVVNPLNPSTVYCGSVSGGIWKSTNAGGSWFPVSDASDNLVIGSMVIDPADTNTIYAGTGEGYANIDALRGIGVLKSTNGGSSWTLQNNFTGLTASGPFYVNKLVIQPDQHNTLFAALVGGIWKTTDGGSHWTKLSFSTTSTACVDLVMDPTNYNILYAAFGLTLTDGIYKTTNGGSSWSKLTNGFIPATDKYHRISLAISESDPQILYASVADSLNGTHSIQKSTNGGALWFTAALRQPYDTLLGKTHLGDQGWYDNVIAVHPTNPNIVFAGGNDMFISTNGGTNWRMLTYGYTGSSHPFMHVDQHAIVFDPTNSSIIYFGNDGGMYKTNDGGATILDINNNLAVTQFYYGAVDPDHEIYYGGSQDLGILKSATIPAWTIPFVGDAGVTLVDYNTHSTIYSEYVFLAILKSTNSGQYGSWSPSVAGIPQKSSNPYGGAADRCDFIAPIAMDPTNPQHLIAGTYKVYSTTNGGTLWSAASGDLTGDGPGTQGSKGGVISALAISSSSPSTWYAGTGFVYSGYGAGSGLAGYAATKVWVTTNNGATWDSINTATLPNRYVRAIGIDPTNQNRLFICYSGYGGGHIFRSINRGVSWTDVSLSLPDIPVNAIVIDPTSPSHLIVGTDLGIFESFDNGTNWIQQNTGLANVAVVDLDLRPDQYLFATTHGRGMFKSSRPISSPLSHHDTILVHQNPILSPYIDVYLISDTATNPASASMNIYIAPSTQDSIPLVQQSSPQIFKGSYQFKTSGTAIISATVEDPGGTQMYTQRIFQVQLVKQGVVQTMQSPDGIAKIVIDGNALSEDIYFTIVPDAIAQSETRLLGKKYTFGPGREFATPMALTFRYDPTIIPEGKLSSLTILRFDGSTWMPITTAIDEYHHTLTSNVSSLGTFAVGYGDRSRSQQVPEGYILHQNYPNPFNPSTTISYSLPDAGDVRLEIYDLTGSVVRLLVHQTETGGEHSAVWDGKDHRNNSVASGVYCYRLMVKKGEEVKSLLTRKMLLIK